VIVTTLALAVGLSIRHSAREQERLVA
jgi:hypothetical protein